MQPRDPPRRLKTGVAVTTVETAGLTLVSGEGAGVSLFVGISHSSRPGRISHRGHVARAA